MNSEPEDFFESAPQPEQPRQPKEPDPAPDDPRYYEDEDPWEHLRPAARNRKMWIMIITAGIILGALYALYLRYLTPYSDQRIQYGYVERIERRGHIFKTFEGVFLPYKSLADTVQPYEGDLVFSTANDHLAAELLKLQLANLPARIQYATYSATVPWRGESRIIITAVDTADVTKIFPPASGRQLIPGSDAPINRRQ